VKKIGIDRTAGCAYAGGKAMIMILRGSDRCRCRGLVGFALAGMLACTPSDGTNTESETADGTTQGATTHATTHGMTHGGTTSGGTTSGGSSGETGTPTSGGSSGGAETGTGAPSFTEVYENVIVGQGCTAGYCHGGMAGGLELTDEATSYANLVEVDATTAACGLMQRVVPGAPEQSILWMRVRPAAEDMGMGCAPKMPQGSMGLADADATLVKEWIAGGALE
jgi:hypothetical protein